MTLEIMSYAKFKEDRRYRRQARKSVILDMTMQGFCHQAVDEVSGQTSADVIKGLMDVLQITDGLVVWYRGKGSFMGLPYFALFWKRCVTMKWEDASDWCKHCGERTITRIGTSGVCDSCGKPRHEVTG